MADMKKESSMFDDEQLIDIKDEEVSAEENDVDEEVPAEENDVDDLAWRERIIYCFMPKSEVVSRDHLEMHREMTPALNGQHNDGSLPLNHQSNNSLLASNHQSYDDLQVSNLQSYFELQVPNQQSYDDLQVPNHQFHNGLQVPNHQFHDDLQVPNHQFHNDLQVPNHQSHDDLHVPNHKFHDGSQALSTLPSNDSHQPDDLPQGHHPHGHKPVKSELFPRSFSVPTTYNSEMIRVVIGVPSRADKVKMSKANRRPSPFPFFKPENSISCPGCGVVVASKGHLKRHQVAHGANQLHTCSLCDCSFTRKEKLSDHRQRAHGIIPVT